MPLKRLAGLGGPLALLLVGAAAFIWVSSQSMPDIVASHFEGDGYANGFMRRGVYIGFMLAFSVGLPAVVALISIGAVGRPGARINLPHRDYWLAPERRERSVAYLRRHMARFIAALVVFLCYSHWLVVRANGLQPPRLQSSWMLSGLALFGVFVVVWMRALWLRFRMPRGVGR